MERRIIFKNTEDGTELTLPLTPASYPMAQGRGVERLDMAVTGQAALPGLEQLMDARLEFLLPARAYPFLTPGASTDPDYYLELLSRWSRNGDVCRYIVVGTGINLPVLLGELEYGEEDGSNDVSCTLPLYEYRYLEEAEVDSATENSTRALEASSQPETAGSYTVVSGDSLWAICKRFYGDGSLAYQLATANHIANPSLIYPGQVLTLPELSGLRALSPTTGGSGSSLSAKKTQGASVTTEKTETTEQAVLSVREGIGLIRESTGLGGILTDKWAEKMSNWYFPKSISLEGG